MTGKRRLKASRYFILSPVIKTLVLIFFSFGILVSAFSASTFEAGEKELLAAPQSQEFLDYIEIKKDPGKKELLLALGEKLGYIPSPIEIKGHDTRHPLLGSDELPSYYAPKYQTPAKDQAVSGPCWAFASLGTLESFLLKKEQYAYDFSERNMMNNHGYAPAYDAGGNRDIAMGYLTRWAGPVFEADDYPYDPPSSDTVGVVPPRKHVQSVAYIPNFDTQGIKRAIMEYGAVGTSMYYDSSRYNDSTNSYYCPNAAMTNHGVIIVGWDDNFSKTNFKTPPPGNGAYIVKNSWGSSWGDDGYFYVSYHDAQIGKNNYAYTQVEQTVNYDRIYQHDTYGWVTSVGYDSETAWFANAFHTGQTTEQLQAVSFYTRTANASYEIYFTAGPGMYGMTLKKSGTLAQPGYHTIKLDAPVTLMPLSRFVVAVRLTTPGSIYPIPIECNYSGYLENATQNAGESYVRSDSGSWADISAGTSGITANVCLKAFTTVSNGTRQALFRTRTQY